jgi:hypothetical protein
MGSFAKILAALQRTSPAGRRGWTYTNKRSNWGIGDLTPAMKLQMAT